MYISEGSFLSEKGEEVSVSGVVAQKDAEEKPKLWGYDGLRHNFVPRKATRILPSGQTTRRFEIVTDSGAKLAVPSQVRVLIRRHGVETLIGVEAMCMGKSWRTGDVVRAKLNEKQKLEKQYEKIASVTDLTVEPEDRGVHIPDTPDNTKDVEVYTIEGAPELGRLWLVNGFLIT